MPFTVGPFTADRFRELLAKHSEASPETVASKLHSSYFESYFREVGVKTVVAEEQYVDHDYLEDFSAYYVKCFYPYKRYCARLHFFRDDFSHDEFSDYLRGSTGRVSSSLLRASYVGFIVVRPLPSSIIGRTCLVAYNTDSGRRHFPTLSRTEANLFGLDLEVHTLPFQEQDQVTAACATSALWSAFQATARAFQHRLLSPVEITRSATIRMPLRSRALPNTDGLTIEQMAHAIREVGLEPYFVSGSSEFVLRSAIYSYVAAGIPALLVFSLSADDGKGGRSVIGNHAATVTGFSLPPRPAGALASNQVLTVADRIDRLYVHDDQVGPHARMSFATSATGWHLTSSWGLNRYTDVRAQPLAVLLPLYNKIRIPFTGPLSDVMEFDLVLAALGPVVPVLSTRPEWNFRLTTVNRLKKEILSSSLTTGALKAQLLTSNFPRYVWQATATNASGLIADILFDATDIDSGRYISRIDIHDSTLSAVLSHLRKNLPGSLLGTRLSAFFAKQNT
jgi:hypothetical protein